MTGIGRVVFSRSRRRSGKVHLWVRVLRWSALGLIPRRAEGILRGGIRRSSILVVPLRVHLGVGGGSIHRRNDRGGCWWLRFVVLFPLL